MDNATANIVEQVRQAAAAGTALAIRGGGSKAFLRPPLQGAALETGLLQGIVAYEPSELVVTVRAGTPLAELEKLLAEHGQCLAFEPPHYRLGKAMAQATCGGMVAAGLSGPARVSVGAVRDFVLGVTLVNGRGQCLHFGGTVMKNVAGYDVSRVLAGSWGQLGVITEVSLKVLPRASAEATLRFELDQAQALAQLQRWNAQPLPVNASCWVDDASAGAGAAGKSLFVRLRGAPAAVHAASEKMCRDAPGQLVPNAQAEPDWQACRDLRLPFFAHAPEADMGLWRLSVAPRSPVLELPWPQLVEWHGAQRWLWAPTSAAADLHRIAVQAGGHAQLYLPAPGVAATAGAAPETQDTALARIQAQVRHEFDPGHIFNRAQVG